MLYGAIRVTTSCWMYSLERALLGLLLFLLGFGKIIQKSIMHLRKCASAMDKNDAYIVLLAPCFFSVDGDFLATRLLAQSIQAPWFSSSVMGMGLGRMMGRTTP